MKKLQLMGLKKKFSKKVPKEPVVYPEIHLVSLPDEILTLIFKNLDKKTLCALSQINKRLQAVSQKTLYRAIRVSSTLKLLQLCRTLDRNSVEQKPWLYAIDSLQLDIDIGNSANEFISVSIGKLGYSSSIKSTNYKDLLNTFNLYKNLMTHLLSLNSISLTQVSPRLNFPIECSLYYKVNDRIECPKNYTYDDLRRDSIKTVRLESQDGISIPLRSHLLWSFGLIKELILRNMNIDEESLVDTRYLVDASSGNWIIDPINQITQPITGFPTIDTIPKHKKSYHSPIEKLTLNATTVSSSALHFLRNYFHNVTELCLLNIKNLHDLASITYFPNIKALTIDLDSKIFWNFLNDFPVQFDSFFSVLCSLHKIQTITFVNVKFFNLSLIPREPVNELDYNSYKVSIYRLFTHLGRIENVSFILTTPKRITANTRYPLFMNRDWLSILWPFVDTGCKVSIKYDEGSYEFQG
ncbi:F-box protein of unknown function [Komagataella phaffii CBS 7435]|uniref:F-box domain-containing protein n=2 Tax=Komagataella phaffii TaxID=460519 RepID=C4R3S7_KOMPG|nr:Hypothetical protein PAS_chr3_0183 [Komagataella phaffii GS115]AOA63572.1 GQ67_03223T0 [Komagataella phaffii]CAH2450059.1 F-box protein of unknown function [Komagataella phaffii CBS 7435]AOA69116.1 GQ68_03192T0 [Komagataella phaffii GS115]CAY70161.1 Hypothetical protein PAS_chr3_0183 [Komagataella phaffii GS115]CCA39992.1 F-box protein of unknown function [Komagataella phaffii CBS 7435]